MVRPGLPFIRTGQDLPAGNQGKEAGTGRDGKTTSQSGQVRLREAFRRTDNRQGWRKLVDS